MPFLTSDLVSRAIAVAVQMVDPIVELTTTIASVPAPTNDESNRASCVATAFRRLGLQDVEVDDLHNVVGIIPGKDRSRRVMLAGHIDTVFPRSTEIVVTRVGDTLAAPGVGDNSVSVACVALLKSALDQLGIVPDVDIVITGNVGEEGLGDLRGMRRVIDDRPDIGAVIAIEGHSLGRITNRAVGSRRLKVTISGPGGHSWGDAGRRSAIHEAARLVARLDQLPLSPDPKTTFNVGLFEGGISVNTIAPEVSMVIDMRSVSADHLDELVRRVETEIAEVESEDVQVVVEVVGDRPAGTLDDTRIIDIGIEVLRALNIEATCDASSTDANIPISRGIPAMCIGLTSGGNVHRADEFIRIKPLSTGFTQLILASLATAHALATGGFD